jgi:hypothetical protein
MLAFSCGPLRPGNAITAAPLREGMYQPSSSRPSLVLKRTSSWATPRRSAGTMARAVWVKTQAAPTGTTSISAPTTPARPSKERRATRHAGWPTRRREVHSAAAATPKRVTAAGAASRLVKSSPDGPSFCA